MIFEFHIITEFILKRVNMRFLLCIFRMDCPPGCPEIIYEIMRSCWKWDPADRPHFWEIHGTLVSLMQPVQYYEEDEFNEPPLVPSFNQTDQLAEGL